MYFASVMTAGTEEASKFELSMSRSASAGAIGGGVPVLAAAAPLPHSAGAASLPPDCCCCCRAVDRDRVLGDGGGLNGTSACSATSMAPGTGSAASTAVWCSGPLLSTAGAPLARLLMSSAGAGVGALVLTLLTLLTLVALVIRGLAPVGVTAPPPNRSCSRADCLSQSQRTISKVTSSNASQPHMTQEITQLVPARLGWRCASLRLPCSWPAGTRFQAPFRTRQMAPSRWRLGIPAFPATLTNYRCFP